jgi:uroporphyrin-III C-methyltransferase
VTVYLVGAGSGNPELITLKGARLLARADVVVYDRLIDARLLQEARPGAELVDVGKQRGQDADLAQLQINDILIDRGRRGLQVVRLKSGDPFLFGRGGEELVAVRAAGVEVEVVPGVSSAFGALAEAGIPVTHRGMSSSVTVISGHDPDAVDWAAVGQVPGTLVILMGASTRAVIARRLLDAGRPSSQPVAVIEASGSPDERRTLTELGSLGDHPVTAPAVIVVGAVASFIESFLYQSA